MRLLQWLWGLFAKRESPLTMEGRITRRIRGYFTYGSGKFDKKYIPLVMIGREDEEGKRAAYVQGKPYLIQAYSDHRCMICHRKIEPGDKVIRFGGENNMYKSPGGIQWSQYYICTDFTECTKRRVERDLGHAEERLAKEQAEKQKAAERKATVEKWVKE